MQESQTNIEIQQQETPSKNINIKTNFEELQTTIFDLGSYNYRIGYSGNDRPNYIFPPIKFINSNAEVHKQEEYEESDSSSDESINNEMSDDEIIFKKYKHRMEKRKSALNSVPVSYKTFSSLKPNEMMNNINNNYGSGQKMIQKINILSDVLSSKKNLIRP